MFGQGDGGDPLLPIDLGAEPVLLWCWLLMTGLCTAGQTPLIPAAARLGATELL